MVIGNWINPCPLNNQLGMPQLLGAFFRLVRWPNLVFIFLTQVLFYYVILLPGFGPLQPHKLTLLLFYLLTASSVLIAEHQPSPRRAARRSAGSLWPPT